MTTEENQEVLAMARAFRESVRDCEESLRLKSNAIIELVDCLKAVREEVENGLSYQAKKMILSRIDSLVNRHETPIRLDNE